MRTSRSVSVPAMPESALLMPVGLLSGIACEPTKQISFAVVNERAGE